MLLLDCVPTYEYECPGCPRVFEIRQRISEPPLETCDRCGGPVHRLLGPAAFILKGGGWYVTEYPSEARKNAIKSEASSSGTTSAEAKSSTPSPTSSSSSGGSDSSGGSSSAGSSGNSGAAQGKPEGKKD